MNTRGRWRAIALLAALSLAAPAAKAAPPIINYQGVLVDSTGAPENGDRDMIFHFHDAAGSGEILRDLHTRADSRPVTVGGGLFNVQLGAGLIQDGSGTFPNDPYTSLDQVFRDFPEVLLEVEIRVGDAGGPGAFETLSPMTPIVSAAYALNADRLGGRASGEFIDTSPAPQAKAGDLTVGDLTATGDDIHFGSSGAGLAATTGGLGLTAGDADGDDLTLTAGNSLDDGGIRILGDAGLELHSGNGLFSFVAGFNATERARLDPFGNLELDGGLTLLSSSLDFLAGMGPQITGGPTAFGLTAGTDDTDDVFLSAGNSFDDGAVLILGGQQLELRSGNGTIFFVNGPTSTTMSVLDGAGNLQVDGDFTASGSNVRGGLASLAVESSSSLQFHLDRDFNQTGEVAQWCTNGDCFFSNQLMQLQFDGDLLVGGALFQNQFDLAEAYLAGEPLEPGDLVRLHPGRAGSVLLSSGVEDRTVLGVVSERPGVVLGGAPLGPERLESMWGAEVRDLFERQRDRLIALVRARHPGLEPAGPEGGEGREDPSVLETLAVEAFYAENFVPVALAGRVPVKVDARLAEILPGDSLSPSTIPGLAMKSDGRGPVIGIALEGLPGGRGKVEAFVVRGDAGASSEALRAIREEAASRLAEQTPDPESGVQILPGHLQLALDGGGDDDARLSVFRDGGAEEARAEVFRVDEEGNVYAKGSFRPNAMDVAELLPIAEPASAGDVLAADPVRPGLFRPAREASDPTVIGVVAAQPGLLLGSGVDRVLAADPALAARLEEARLANDRQEEGRIWHQLESRFHASHAAIAMTGTVLVKADAADGPIRPGDLLASSTTPGHARRADDPAPGTVLGKALEPLASGQGLIRMVVMLR